MTDANTQGAAAPQPSHEQQMIDAAVKAGVQINGQPAAAPAAPPAAAAAAPAVPTRPESVPEKFWNADTGQVNTEALLKSYSELEKKNSAAPAPKPAEAPAAAEQAKVADVLKTATDEIAAGGKISDATKALMEKAGVDEATVSLHADALKSKAAALINKAFEATGGENNYKAMIQWAGANLPPEEAQQFDALIKNADTTLTAVRGLYARFQLEGAQDGKLRMGGAGPGNEDVFRSQAEVTKAISDPRYKNDSAYRKDVSDKLLRSQRSGSVRLGR